MKKLLIFALVLSFVTSFSGFSFSKELKIGSVDVLKVFDEYEKTKIFDKELEAKKTQEEKKLDEKKKEIESMQSKLSLLKEKEQEKEKTKITDAVNSYRDMERDIFMKLKQERDEKMKEIVDDIDKVVKDYAKKNGFDIIINENVLLHSTKEMNLTETILKLVNDKYKVSKK